MLAVPDGFTESGKTHYKMLGRYDRFEGVVHPPGAIKLPCGKCAGCRASKCREWADRMILELDHSCSAVFLTLTYNDEHLPVFLNLSSGQVEPTLKKRDLQLFFKRLRKCKLFHDREIRYYACGEYGSNTNRPHYHVILYNVSLGDFSDLSFRGTNELGQAYYSSDFLANNVWKNGFCLLAGISWNCCAYVARYVKKKDYGLVSDEFVERMKEPEFSVMSRNPGIGMYYVVDHPDFANYSKFNVSVEGFPKSVTLPKPFLNYLEKTDPDFYGILKEQRRQAANDSELSKLAMTDLSSMELDMIGDDKLVRSGALLDSYRVVL